MWGLFVILMWLTSGLCRFVGRPFLESILEFFHSYIKDYEEEKRNRQRN